jgi:hypothetical protein
MTVKRESLEDMVARINRNSFIPPPQKETRIMKTVKMSKKQLDAIESHNVRSGGGFTAKYPWEDFFNGELNLLERHDGPENDKGTIEDDKATVRRDYGVPNDGMLPKIKTAARARYLVCAIYRKDADGKRLVNSMYVRARPMTAEERTAEDLLRAEERADREYYDRVELDAANAAKASGADTATAEAAGKAARKAAVKAGRQGANGQTVSTTPPVTA